MSGRIIHHNDCTWCKHRVVFKKAIQGRYELERCALTGKDCASPRQSFFRRCEHYQQINCTCQKCNELWLTA